MISVGDAPGERHPAGRHLVEHDAEREEVGAVIDGAAERLLRRHVRDRADHHARRWSSAAASPARRALSSPRNFARPKSSTLTRPRSVRIRLALLMSRWMMPRPCASSSASATCRPTSTTSRIGSGPLRDARRQQLALDVLHHDEVGAGVLADVVGDGDVRRAQQRRGARLVQQPRAALGIGLERRRQELQRHRTARGGRLRRG